MSEVSLVHPSRDGDRFHYYWAARRALRLLDPCGALHLVSVEGAQEDPVEGDEVIDIAEYDGGPDADTCTAFRYIQLKHSTLQTDRSLVCSDLKKTLTKFAAIYRVAAQEDRHAKLTFLFVANRRLHDPVRVSLAELSTGATVFTHRREVDRLRKYMGFGADVRGEFDFCRRFRVDDGGPGIGDMARLLREDLWERLPGGVGSEMGLLMDTVAQKATTDTVTRTLARSDVLATLRTVEDEIFPAASKIEQLDPVILTADIDRVVSMMCQGNGNKLLVTAIGGVGKSVLTTALPRILPEDSVTVVFDCFAGGDYRKRSSQRHRHHTALTQLANELAAQGLCTPLIPTAAEDPLYVRVFMRRVHRSADRLAVRNADALLTVVIDAADNAATVAQLQKEDSFATDLVREDWPSNARLVLLCRPERKALLRLPRMGVTEVALTGFSRSETLEHLRSRFPSATDAEAAEFYALSDGNPRVQAMAMTNASSVADAVNAIQIARTGTGAVLDVMLSNQIAEVVDRGHLTDDEATRLCAALATLPPPIPLADLATIAELDVDAIRSFAVALGRGLLAAGDILQFRDEPTETWFRTTHGLNNADRQTFTRAIQPLAARSPYIATALAQLMFEANLLDELVELALSNTGLPTGITALQAQEVARTRARFAIRAMLRVGRIDDAAILAIQAGHLSSGHSRKINVFRTHSDLTARFFASDIIDDLCAGRELATDWPGSNLHVEAALLSHLDRSKDLARSRARAALDNFKAILRLPEQHHPRRRQSVSASEIADLAMAALNVDGPVGAMRHLSRWRPEQAVRYSASKLCDRLADATRYSDLTELVTCSNAHTSVQIAAAGTMFDYNIVPTNEVIASMAKELRTRKTPYEPVGPYNRGEPDVRAVVWVLAHGLGSGHFTDAEVLRVLDIHLPSHLPDGAGIFMDSAEPISALLLGYALRARASATTLEVEAIADEELMRTLKKEHFSDTRAREFTANIPALLPWCECWLSAIIDGATEGVVETVDSLTSTALTVAGHHQPPLVRVNTTAELITRILTAIPQVPTGKFVERVSLWHKNSGAKVTASALTVSRIAARSASTHLVAFSLDVVNRRATEIQADRTDADTRVKSLIALARAVLGADTREAETLFGMAVSEAERVGDDVYSRWQALRAIADKLATGTEAARAYRLFQIAEEMDRTVGDVSAVAVGEHLFGMHEPTYFTATSRARDRRTLAFGPMLTPAFRTRSARSGRADLGHLALFAFRPEMGWTKPVDELPAPLRADATRVFEQFTRYENVRSPRSPRSFETSRSFESSPPIQHWDIGVQFAGVDWTTEGVWTTALEALARRRDDRRDLMELALAANPTRRPDVVDAFTRCATADLADFACMATAAAAQQPTPALRQALAGLGDTVAKRYAKRIATRTYHDEAIEEVAAAAGTTITAMTAIAFEELGNNAHQLDYSEYFQLAANLTRTSDVENARRVFDALADLFLDLAPADASDGPHGELPAPPTTTATGIAGVIWTALGDMAVEVRWHAAHAVHLLVQLGCRTELDALLGFAETTTPATPFIDQRLPFYSMHARMWLLFALARAAHEHNAQLLAAYLPWLADVVGQHHAVNQFLAQHALIELTSRHGLAGRGDREALARRLDADCVELEYRERDRRSDPFGYADRTDGDEHDRYRLFFDFEPYWCRPVAEIFGGTEEDVARRVLEVTATLDGYESFAAEKDPRDAANIYDPDKSNPDHSDWPAQDRLSVYLAVHALFTVGAELAETATAYKDPDLAEDSYTRWRKRFLPASQDGRWLSDRRDPPPNRNTPSAAMLHAEADGRENWPWSLRKQDFEQAVNRGQDWMTLWADTYSAHGALCEDRRIECALVPHETARALLVALQTSKHGYTWWTLPTANDDHLDDDFREAPYELVPLVDNTRYEYGLDKRDPRGAEIRFPPPRPAEHLITRLMLTTDADQRSWYHYDVPVLHSTIWNNTTQISSDHETGTRGEQLEISTSFLTRVLIEYDMTLVLGVGLRRYTDRPYRRSTKDKDEPDWIQHSGKVYLVDSNGYWREY